MSALLIKTNGEWNTYGTFATEDDAKQAARDLQLQVGRVTTAVIKLVDDHR